MKITRTIQACFIFLFLLIPFTLFSQKDFTWGSLSQEEIDLREVAFEPDASAVILKEFGLLEITNYGYKLEQHSQVKILSQNGFDVAQKKWAYSADDWNNRIVLKDAQVINFTDGKKVITPVSKKDIIISRKNEYTEEISFAFPNVTVGSIIEYKVDFYKPYDLYSSPWRFQNDLPTLSSALKLKLIANADYKIVILGERLNKKYQNKRNNKEWLLENIPSISTIDKVYNPNDYVERIMFQYTSQRYAHGTYYSENSWKGFKKLINADIEKSSKNVDFREMAGKIKNGSNQLETLENCVRFLQDNYRWNEYLASKTGSLKDGILKEKSGNSADFNILLNHILKEKGIRSELVINSLRSNGKIIPDYPVFSRMQTLINIITFDGGERMMIDAAVSDPKNIKYLDLDYFNYITLKLDSPADVFYTLSPNLSTFVSQQVLVLSSKKNELKLKDTYNGYFDSDHKLSGVVYGDLKYENEEESSEGWKIKKSIYDIDNVSFYTLENPFVQIMKEMKIDEDRNYPVELDFPMQITTQLKNNPPEDCIPEITVGFDQEISAFQNSLQYVQKAEKNNHEITVTWTLYINKIIFQPSELPEFRKFINQIMEASSKAVLIKRL